MRKTQFERIEKGSSDSAVFQISGKLGFHQNGKVELLLEECRKRGFNTVIFDFSDLLSLGGGVAKILRNFVNTSGESGKAVKFVITNGVILDFLKDDDVTIDVYKTLDDALSGTAGSSGPESPKILNEAVETGQSQDSSEENERAVSDTQDTAAAENEISDKPENSSADVIMMPYDGDSGTESAEENEDGSILTEIFNPQSTDTHPSSTEKPAPSAGLEDKMNVDNILDSGGLNKKLKRRILELKTLFSISADFNAIKDRNRLMEIFLLTSIAQGGVESAVFFEKTDELFEPVMFKGVKESSLKVFSLSDIEIKKITGNHDLIQIDSGSFNDETAGGLKEAGLEYFYPFNVKDGLAGFVFLGKRITGRGMQKEDFEFMKILINIAQSAFQNAIMHEREHQRTLGIVKTLISLIEENTLLSGTSEFVSRYVGMVAKDINYPEEHFNDLIYGTVLRDMGMIKVSDLIVRSPRELNRDEWNVINRHPEDGAEMLRRMKFNDHVVNMVLSHHERFNGEGYPRGLRGKEIPLGARIISVVESYSAMIHERPNRPALSEKEALQTLKENYGLRYDREIVKRFVAIMEKEIARSVKPATIVS
ncbi:MAG: HD domain-containing protein [Candidatus Krumholzibacteriota bacterium]|nr:HD domain-containing protein [Candidatus Krumholzibacteriota bacterium]